VKAQSILPSVLLAATALPVAAAPETPSLASSLGQMVLGLGVVIALLLASLWLIKRLTSPRGAASGLRVLGGVSIGSRERVVLVEVAGKVLVLGVSAANVNTLHTLDASELHQAAESAPTQLATRPEGEFARWLKLSLDRRGNRS